MEMQYFKEYSPALNRDMECKVYGHAGKPVLFIPCQDGRFLTLKILRWQMYGHHGSKPVRLWSSQLTRLTKKPGPIHGGMPNGVLIAMSSGLRTLPENLFLQSMPW